MKFFGSRPSVEEVYAFLRRHSALIVHFSGTPKGAGSNYDYEFPADLWNVLNTSTGGISCSLVKPGDEFNDLRTANATGCIGVVVGLSNAGSITAVDPHDTGSMVLSGERIAQHSRDIYISDLEASLTERISYNEWCVKNYVPLAVFGALPLRISRMQVPEYPPDFPSFMRDNQKLPNFSYLTFPELRDIFPDTRLITFCDHSLLELKGQSFEAINHSDVYGF
jgi:hypothetical protein